MSNFLDSINPFFLVSLGAVIGACLRSESLDYLEYLFKKRYFGTALVNSIATLFLVISTSYFSNPAILNDFQSFWLFFCVGFLGSLSTFSTFILDLFSLMRYGKLKDFFLLLFTSISGAIFFAYLGLYLANA